MLKRFLIYGLLGWNMEVIWTGLYSLSTGDVNMQGSTSLWMFIIYGSSVFILEPVHHHIRDWRWPIRGMIWVILIWFIEYTTGFMLREFLGIKPWNYEGKFAIDGLVRLDYAPAWFIAGLLFEKAHNLLDRLRIA